MKFRIFMLMSIMLMALAPTQLNAQGPKADAPEPGDPHWHQEFEVAHVFMNDSIPVISIFAYVTPEGKHLLEVASMSDELMLVIIGSRKDETTYSKTWLLSELDGITHRADLPVTFEFITYGEHGEQWSRVIEWDSHQRTFLEIYQMFAGE